MCSTDGGDVKVAYFGGPAASSLEAGVLLAGLNDSGVGVGSVPVYDLDSIPVPFQGGIDVVVVNRGSFNPVAEGDVEFVLADLQSKGVEVLDYGDIATVVRAVRSKIFEKNRAKKAVA